MTVLAIDPGTNESAWVFYDGSGIVSHAIQPNADVLHRCMVARTSDDVTVVIEQIESFGMAVGREVFETVFWTGRFYEAAWSLRTEVHRMPRKIVKVHLCQSTRAQDSNIRVALLDRFGGKDAAIGRKASPGPLFGIKSHEWSALAIAVTWWDQHQPVQRQAAIS